MPVRPYLREEFSRQRERCLLRRHGSVRYRAGWVLIVIGLALAQGSGDAGS
jgi:hypothetical protein